MNITLCDKCNNEVKRVFFETQIDLRDGYTHRFYVKVIECGGTGGRD